jgi:hypothetical protein
LDSEGKKTRTTKIFMFFFGRGGRETGRRWIGTRPCGGVEGNGECSWKGGGERGGGKEGEGRRKGGFVGYLFIIALIRVDESHTE